MAPKLEWVTWDLQPKIMMTIIGRARGECRPAGLDGKESLVICHRRLPTRQREVYPTVVRLAALYVLETVTLLTKTGSRNGGSGIEDAEVCVLSWK